MFPVRGHCSTQFQLIRDEFERNFADRGEVGASVCLIHEGQIVIDLWGGSADRANTMPWERDTIGLVWSSTKGATALCAHILHARNLLKYDERIAHYWPTFAQNGKDTITVRMLLNHRAGVPAIRQPLKANGMYEWDYITGLLEREIPFWEPGTAQGYHAMTFGFLVGELVRRTSGMPIDEFFRNEIAEPLKLDFHFGLPEADEQRVAPTIRPDLPTKFRPLPAIHVMAAADPKGVQALALKNTGWQPGQREFESRRAHAAVLPSYGAITNARGLARLYAPLSLDGSFDGVRVVDDATLTQMATLNSAAAVDTVLRIGVRFGLGYWKSSDNRHAAPEVRDSLILSESAFGHPGMGGSIGFADSDAQIAFGYTMNKQGSGVALNERGQCLVDAVYRSLGYSSNVTGSWKR